MKEEFTNFGGSSCPQDDGRPVAKGANISFEATLPTR
jgi:hypothetical protein